jgi:serine/threonine-protein kinase HipA
LVGAEEVVRGLSEVCSAPLAATRTLFGYFVFSILIGNGDLHAKNLAVYKKHGDWRVTPAYDLVSTVAYGDHTMALPLHGSLEFSPKRLLSFSDSLGLPRKLAAGDIAKILKRSSGLEEELVGTQHGSLTLERARESQGTIAYRRKLLGGVL